MTPPAVIDAAPRLFPLAEPTLEEVVLEMLAERDLRECLVCGGQTEPVHGGVLCHDCGTELLVGEEDVDGGGADVATWVA